MQSVATSTAQASPNDEDAALNLAEAELAAGQVQNAARRLLELQHRLGKSSTRRRGAELLLRARCDEAAALLAVTVAQDGAEAWAWCWHFAVRMRAKGNWDASRAVLTSLRDAQSDSALRMRADMGLALGLPAAYASATDLRNVRKQFEQNLTAFVHEYKVEKVESMSPAPDKLCWENFLLAYHGENDVHLQALFGRWLTECLSKLLPQLTTAPLPPKRARPRLVMVSSYFHECTIGWYFASWVETLAKQNWELILVHTSLDHDALSERLARFAHATITL